MLHLETNTVFPSPCWGKEEQTGSVHVQLTIGTVVSHNSGVPASKGYLVSCAQVDGNDNMSSTLSG